MPKINARLPLEELDEILLEIEDAQELNARELEEERRARLAEQEKRRFMSEPAQALARRIPVSVFAMGDLIIAGC